MNNNRIAKNTLYLYGRMFLILIVNLYVVKVVLQALGTEDYGLYNVIAGVVTLFSFLSLSLSSGAQRFFSVDIGKGDIEHLQINFSITFYIYGCIALVSLILLETCGVWFLNTKMNIPENRFLDANVVFQISLFTFVCNVITVPFNAAVIAYEKMSFFAILSIIETLAKLLIAVLLIFLPFNKLIIYSILILFSSLSILLSYVRYVYSKLPGCRVKIINDFSGGIGILKYSGWNLVGTLAIVLRNQGTNILLNIFFNPIVNAAQAIAQQVYNLINQLITNIYLASRPQITKDYAIGAIDNMWNLIFVSGKIAYFLLLLISIPTFLCIDFILEVWLNNVPEYTVLIIRMLIMVLLIETITNQIFGGFQAMNKLRRVQSISSTILILNLPISYLALSFNDLIILPYLVSISLSIFYALSIVIIAHIEIGMSIWNYVKNVVLPSLLVTISSSIIPIIIRLNIDNMNWAYFLMNVICSILSVCVCVWFWGLNCNERNKIKILIKNKIK